MVQHLKKTLRECSFNVLDTDDKSVYRDSNKLKLIKDLTKDLAILKPDKRNGAVLVSNYDFNQSFWSLFLDKSKFRLINKDPNLTYLSSLQTLFNRSEVNKDQFKKLRPQSAMVARAQALPKVHGSHTCLPRFCRIDDTRTTWYYNVSSFVTKNLTQLPHNELFLKNS